MPATTIKPRTTATVVKQPPKPADYSNGLIFPTTHDKEVSNEVLAALVPADTITFSVSGSPYLRVSDVIVNDLVLTSVDPSELPPGHVGPVGTWEEDLSGEYDGSTPVPVTQGQRVHVRVALKVPEHAIPPGPVTGTLTLQGSVYAKTVALQGTYLAVADNTPIAQKWNALGGELFFGAVVTNAHPAPFGSGSIQEFANGGALWDTDQGVFYLSKDVYAKWRAEQVAANASGQIIATVLGSPVEDTFTTVEGGQAMRFQGGVIVIHGNPAEPPCVVYGAIFALYNSIGNLADGRLQPVLGLPLTDELSSSDGVGRFNNFRNGSIYWTPATGAHEVHGAIRDHWISLGAELGFLGYPATDEAGTPDGAGRFNHFQGGSIYWTPTTGAHEVHGAIRDRWAQLGWERSYPGYPASDEGPWVNPANNVSGRISRFQFGSLGWTAVDGVVELPDEITQSGSVLTPAGTALGGSVTFTVRSNGTYTARFSMHDSGVPDYDFQVRAMWAASDGTSFFVQHSGHVEGTVSTTLTHAPHRDDDYTESGSHLMIRQRWSAVSSGRLWITKDYSATGVIGFIEDAAKMVLDVVAGAAGGTLGVIIALGSEAGQLLGNLGIGGTFGLIAGVVVFAFGGSIVMAVIAGVAVGAVTNALIKQRPIAQPELDFVAPVFKGTLPGDQIVLTNLGGLGGRAFTMPGVDGKIYVNLANDQAFNDPLNYTSSAYPAKGQLLVHELTHAWQISHSSFVPGTVCEGIVNQANNQVGQSVYQYGPPGSKWSDYGLEAQGAIVDQWFGGNPTAAVPNRSRGMDTSDPYYTYILNNIQANVT